MRGRLVFYKYQACGNDFVLVDEFEEKLVNEEGKSKLARLICDRRFGVGSDGLLFISRSDLADARMRIFNPDGSEAEMCGNGLRCVALHLRDFGHVEKDRLSIETLAGILEAEIIELDSRRLVRLSMGRPRFLRKDIPAAGDPDSEMIGEKIETSIGTLEIHALNTGVPHVVVFVDNLDSIDVIKLGREIRNRLDIFPQGTNVNFVRILSEDTLMVRTYERGVESETYSCGTGVTAAAVISMRLGFVKERRVRVITRACEMFVEYDGEIAYLEGPAERIFKGEIESERILSAI